MQSKLRFNKVLLLLTMATLCLYNCKKDDENVPAVKDPLPAISLATDAKLGKLLTDSAGMTLYFFTKDNTGASVCEGGCLSVWPIFYSEKITVSEGLSAADFATITRTDGTPQTTYKGWPLYYYAKDTKAGDVTGEDVGKVWYVAKPDYSLMLANNDIQYLTDTKGKTLYYFTVDETDVSNCTEGCLAKWPEFYAENLTAPSVLLAADFKTITRSDGKKQTTYKGRPLYYYADDVARGDNKGRAVGGVWYEMIP